jgi:phage baseplate assembly protein W
MSWSFYIRNGDLSFAGPGGFATVSGQQKLIQDLKNWLLEPRGTDPMHPDYGCILDGGLLPDGTVSDGMIGNVLTSESLVDVESEVRRVMQAYQQQQLDRLQRESAQFAGKNTFSAGEILATVVTVNIQQVADTVLVNPIIQTADGDQLSFTQAVN